ncbi:MAG TPA: DUF742 domain-containing protein [Amycolatopsis sp.]|uniref:DUF742 domain-containing protein n=1 Tax=Amycolatopsis sp. TaxID=37632 RepID=UPI002B4A5BB4|nr:DUF742 domain-containing protein [Amycolatopsis sp.]HKS44576.1 DUF742 domain-containing protein [Amycolatopsis sp.]
MSRRALDEEDPDRLYTVTGGRSRAEDDHLDVVTLIVSAAEPVPGMQSEYARILRMCRAPTSVVEISAELRLPVSVVRILVSDLLTAGKVAARHPSTGRARPELPDAAFLEKVLVGLHNL